MSNIFRPTSGAHQVMSRPTPKVGRKNARPYKMHLVDTVTNTKAFPQATIAIKAMLNTRIVGVERIDPSQARTTLRLRFRLWGPEMIEVPKGIEHPEITYLRILMLMDNEVVDMASSYLEYINSITPHQQMEFGPYRVRAERVHIFQDHQEYKRDRGI